MTAEEFVNMDPQVFGARLAELDAADCERLGRDLFYRLGGTGAFEDYVTMVMRAAVLYRGSRDDQFAEIGEIAMSRLPNVPPGYDIFGRFIALTMKIIATSLRSLAPSDAGKRPTDRNPGRPG
jgi:hypothetical protein